MPSTVVRSKTMARVLFALLLSQSILTACDSYRLNARILNGDQVQSIIEFPYQVAIFARRNGVSTLSSGAIISESFILTCAHCVRDSESAGVFYGITSLSDATIDNYQTIESDNYRIHPNYRSFENDIALIMTSQRFVFNDKIRPVKLPRKSDASESYESHDRIQLAAWGFFSESNQISNSLLYANAQMLSTAECIRLFGENLVNDKVICSRTLHCGGDSGSVLIDRRDNGDFLAVGVASFANYAICSEGSNHASAYMRVASYLDFIDAHTNLISD